MLIRSNSKGPPNELPVTLPTSGRTFDEILEFVINNLPKITLSKKEDQPSLFSTEEEMSTKNAKEASKASELTEILCRTKEPVSLSKNPLYRQRNKMTSKGHPENYKPQQPMGNINQTNNDKEELMHKQKTNTKNPFANCGPTSHPNFGSRSEGPTNHTQSNLPIVGMQGSNANGGTFRMSNSSNCNNIILVPTREWGIPTFQIVHSGKDSTPPKTRM
eukprot:Gb_09604 [translate_table: standard]